MTAPDPLAEQGKATDIGASVWVAASAGTGKTKVLTDRVLALMLDGNAPQRILCITFTKAAAAEMSIRLNNRLSAWAIADNGTLTAELRELLGGAMPTREQLDEARRLFARLLDAPGGMRIDTIHAFCQSVLRRFPIEAGVAPHFEVMDERSANEAMTQARLAILERPVHETNIAEIAAHANEGVFAELIDCVVRERARLGVFLADGIEEALAKLRRALAIGLRDTPEAIVAAACSGFDDGALLAAARTLISDGSKTDRRRGHAIADWLGDPARRPARFDDYLSCYFTQKGEPRKDIYTKPFGRYFSQEAGALDAELMRIQAVKARRDAASLYRATAALVRVGAALLTEYDRHKAARALLDYDDLILKTRDLLHSPGVAPWVLFKLDGGIDHILIDEAQDTNPEQWQVIEALAEEFFSGEGARALNRTIFAVGDVKQSIFSFQRADRTAFPRMRDRFRRRVTASKWRDADLGLSFRSVPPVLQTVDAVFARPDAAEGVVPEDTILHHAAHREGMAGLVELWPPVAPEEDGDESPWNVAETKRRPRTPQARLARAIAARIAGWIARGEELPARGRPIRAGDILVLVRRRNDFLVEIVRALKDQKIAVAGADRMILTNQIAVEDLMALGNFLLLPEDELTLATVLKGPLFGFDDDLLYRLAHGRERTLWAELRARASDDTLFTLAVEELSALLARADFVPPYELFAEVLSARGGRRATLRRLGPDAADPLDEFLTASLQYERMHGPSLQGFLAWLQAGEVEVKRDLDQSGRDEVRIMTVHGAKGLQAPIVILPDTLQMPGKLEPVLWSDDGMPLWCGREGGAPIWDAAKAAAVRARAQEYRRLLYVALTRAEDRLYVGGWHTKRAPPTGNWFELIHQGLESLGGIEKRSMVFDGPDGWSGEGLRLETKQTAPPKREKDAAPAAQAEEPLPEWLRALPSPEPSPPKPLAPSRPGSADPPARSPLGNEDGDPYQRGRLVHRLLQSLPDLPTDARDAAGRRYLGLAAHWLTPEQQESILAETLAVLDQTEFAPLFGPASRAEVPIVAVLGQRAIAGQIDRLVVLPDRVLIVDYKTLRPPPSDPDSVSAAYLDQLAAYRAAVQAIYPGRAVEAALLWTEEPRLMPIPARLLDRHAPGAGLVGVDARGRS